MRWNRILALIALFAILIPAGGQSRKDLEAKRNANKREIEIARRILSETSSKRSESLQTLTLLEQQIEQRKNLIDGLGMELTLIDAEIDVANEDIAALNREIDELKEEFSTLLYQAYKMRKKNSVLYFMLSSTSFNQAIKRMHFIRDLVSYRKKQLRLIVDKQKENSGNIFRLIRKKNSKLSLVNQRRNEMSKLEGDQEDMKNLVEVLKGKEEELKKELQEKRRIERELDKAIQRAIREEIERSKRIAETRRKGRNTRNEATDIDKVIGSNFGENKGALPWPVSYGYISEPFGKHKHPRIKNITTENNGVNIATRDGEYIKAVFEGKVSAVLQVPGMKNSVLMKHGGYYTVYANLDDVEVKSGQEVKRGERLGIVKRDARGLSEFHFEIWKGSTKLDPAPWLGRL